MPCRFPGPHPGGKLRGLARGVSMPTLGEGCLIWGGCLLQEGGSAPMGVSAPGGVPGLGGCLLQEGVRGDPP